MNETSTPSFITGFLNKHNFRCSKKLGQNFLADGNIVQKIIAAADLTPGDIVVEIGPGLGALTGLMAARSKRVVALEIDLRLVGILRDTVGHLPNVEVVAGDALKTDFDCLVKEKAGYKGRYKLVANLPYSVTTPLIMHLLRRRFSISRFVVMVQQEVAERITAVPGNKDYGSVTVAVQYYTCPQYLFKVPGTVFIPKPEVDSAVVRMLAREVPAVCVADEDLFFRVVRAAFGQRRKTCLNSLAAAFPEITKQQLVMLLEEAGVDPRRRGETLSIEEYGALTGVVQAFSTG